jgi:hypothetical protein
MIPTVFLPKLPDIKESTPEMHFRLRTRGGVARLVLLTINRSIHGEVE